MRVYKMWYGIGRKWKATSHLTLSKDPADEERIAE